MSGKLLLFDIDGTLIDSAGVGLLSLREGFFGAFPELEGRAENFPELQLGGATDGGVAMQIFEAFGIEDTGNHRRTFYELYSFRLLDNLRFSKPRSARILSGVEKLLDHIAEDTDHQSALLTGNAERGAKIKTAHFGIDHHFPFGAYGDDHHDRNELGPIAIKRAEQHSGVRFSGDQVVVIGDTPRDIECARACGASVIAVTTGSASREVLAECEPDYLFDDLSDTEAIVCALKK